MQRSVTYLRVSGDGQIAGDGFPRQREACMGFASKNNIKIVAEFRDEGVTGKMELENRAGLSACLQYVRENNIDMVIVESSDRLARDMIVAEVVVREFQKLNVRVMSASGGVDLTEGDESNPTAKLIRQILAAVAEFDRCVIVLKLRGARQRKKAKYGKGEGRHAFGEKPEEADSLKQIMAWREAGIAPKQITQNLNSGGIKSRSGLPWRVTTVAKIIRRLEAT